VTGRAFRAVLVATLAAGLSLVAVGRSSAASAGALNDRSCASAEHPNPVILLHGLGAPPDSNFRSMGPALAAAGYCAFTLNYGSTSPLMVPGGLDAMDRSAARIREFVTEIREATGAAEVDLVGHSEGGLHSLYVPKEYSLSHEVGRVVALAPPTHGTDGSGLLTVARALGLPPLMRPLTALFGCTACDEIAISQSFIERLNDGPIAQPGIEYTIIASRGDYIVTPTSTSFVQEPGVRNIVVQDICPSDPVGHIGLAFDTGVLGMITNALDPDHATPVTCTLGPPY
jgi:pimeloyl-ACP methyl ester carboxylesterase